MELKNIFVQDAMGNIVPSPQVFVYLPGTTTLATGLKNVVGGDLANPFVGTDRGQVAFRAPDGEYDLRAVGVGRDFTMRVRFIDAVAYGDQLEAISADLNSRVSLIALAAAAGSALVGWVQAGTGAVSRLVRDKLRETVSIRDFGAVEGDTGDQRAAIQKALDTGKHVFIPEGVYRVLGNLTPKPGAWGQRIFGAGPGSVLHLSGEAPSGLFDAVGTKLAPLRRIELRDFTMLGDCTFAGGLPSLNNGDAVDFQFTDRCTFANLIIRGFNANGIAVANGSHNLFQNCQVDECGQSIALYANAISPEGNQVIGCRVVSNGRYNAIHLEGSAGGPELGEGVILHTVLSGNFVADSYGHGINIENAPHTTCSANTVARSGPGEEAGLSSGIILFGSPYSSVTACTISGCVGPGIVVGANSSFSTVSGNTTHGNAESMLLTDSSRIGGEPIQVSNYVSIGPNNFSEGSPVLSGNVTVRSNDIVIKGTTEAETLQRLDGRNIQRVWLAPDGAVVWREGICIDQDPTGLERQWFREGVVALALTGAGLVRPNLPVFADNAAAIAGGVSAGCLYATATGEVRARV